MKKLLCKPCAVALEARGKTVKPAAGRCEKITCAECGRRRFGIPYDVTGWPTNIMKDLEPQLVIPETAAEEMNNWRVGERGDDVDMVPVIMQGFQIFQTAEGAGACWGIPLSYLDMVERDAAEHDGAVVVDNCRLLWDDGGEAIAVEAVRKAKSGWAKAWERAVWEALEGVDLHKEEE